MPPVRGKKSALQIGNKPYFSTCQSYITAPTPAVTATAPTATITASATPTATTTPTTTITTITVLLLRNGTFKI